MKNKKFNFTLIIIILPILFLSTFLFSSCDDSGILNPAVPTHIGATDRLPATNSQVAAEYGANTKLVMIFGRNVNSDGTTDVSKLTLPTTSLDSIGAWIYVYRPDSLTPVFKLFTPNPDSTQSNCIELTSAFTINSFVGLITDTSARSRISNSLLTTVTLNIGITTPTAALLNSTTSIYLSDTVNPLIKFDSVYHTSPSTYTGNVFNNTGSNKTQNMFLIPASGTLNMTTFIPTMTGYPPDIWIVNFSKLDNNNVLQNLVIGTIVQSNQSMIIPGVVTSDCMIFSGNVPQ
jgi:hypothetical protein